MWLIGSALFILMVILILTSRSTKNNKFISEIPGPNVNSLLAYLSTSKITGETLLPIFGRLRRRYGDIFKTWQGSKPVVHLMAPQYIEVILGANKHIRKGDDYDFLLPWLGTGLLTSQGSKWFTHRKLITPTFHFKVLEGFLDVFNETSQVLTGKLAIQARKGTYFDIFPFITRCTLDIICETAMGTQINAQENNDNDFLRATLKISELVVQRQFNLWLHPDWIYYRTTYGKEYRKCLETLHHFTKSVIKDRKESRRNTCLHSDSDDLGMKKRTAFLDLLLESAECQKLPMTDSDIREEVDTFMFEGHDTTTTAITWCLLLLGNHRDIQEAVRAELQEIFQGQNRPANLRDIGHMKLLERVIKETLRLYPSVNIITRVLDTDTQLGKYLVPANTNVAMHIYTMHRHPDLYQNPLEFRPERFLPEKNRHPYAYIPFSAGQRNCIGQKFAMYEEKVMLSSILRQFRVIALDKVEQVKPVHGVVNRPKTGVRVKLIPI